MDGGPLHCNGSNAGECTCPHSVLDAVGPGSFEHPQRRRRGLPHACLVEHARMEPCSRVDLRGTASMQIQINNAWQIRQDWDFCIFPNDFPEEKRPKSNLSQKLITHYEYVPIQNKFGGFV